MDLDLNKLLALLKGQDIITPNLPPPPAAIVETTNLTTELDFSNISQSVIDQVRNEYLTKKNTNDNKIKNATSITPEVLVTIGRMVQETDLIKVLRKCKERQDDKEKELFSHRESIKSRYKKQKESVLAKELIGVKIDSNELKFIERESNQELRQLDLQIIKDMDKEVVYLQQEFVKLNVPLFKVTKDSNELKLQQRVLVMLQDMI